MRRAIEQYSGDMLKRRRENALLTQEELARRVGVSKQSVSNWETLQRYPSLANVRKLRDVLFAEMRKLATQEKDVQASK